MKNESFQIKSPHAKLRTSWVEMAYTKPKKSGNIITRSLGKRATPIIRGGGMVVGVCGKGQSNVY
jgi:hypothetical protein